MFFLNKDTLESLSRSDVLGAVEAVQVDGVVIVDSVSKKLMSAFSITAAGSYEFILVKVLI